MNAENRIIEELAGDLLYASIDRNDSRIEDPALSDELMATWSGIWAEMLVKFEGANLSESRSEQQRFVKRWLAEHEIDEQRVREYANWLFQFHNCMSGCYTEILASLAIREMPFNYPSSLHILIALMEDLWAGTVVIASREWYQTPPYKPRLSRYRVWKAWLSSHPLDCGDDLIERMDRTRQELTNQRTRGRRNPLAKYQAEKANAQLFAVVLVTIWQCQDKIRPEYDAMLPGLLKTLEPEKGEQLKIRRGKYIKPKQNRRNLKRA